METELDLKAASRKTLLALITEQQVVIAQLQRRIGALESQLKRRGSLGMPGNKPPSGQQSPEKAGAQMRPQFDGKMTLDSGLRWNDVPGIMPCPDIFGPSI